MQIGDSTYLDIKVKGSNRRDFITPQNLNHLTIVESAGASLPYASFSFFSEDTDIIELFIENNKVEMSIGNTPEDADTFYMEPIPTPKDTDSSDATATIFAGGFLCSKPFMVDKGECKSYKGNSLMVAKKVIQRFEGLDSKIDSDFSKVDENQVVWRQLYETASSFLVRVLLHMNVQPSFPLFSFDKFGKFYIRDYKKVVEKGPTVRFTPFEPNKGEIRYLNKFKIKSYKPSYNMYSGYNKVTEICGADEGIAAYSIADNVPMLSSSSEAEKSLAGNRVSLNKVQSANVHKKYVEAYAHNTNKLLALSSMQGVLEIAGYHPELKPTDLVYVQTPKENGEVSSIEGLYLIDTIILKYKFGDNVPKTFVYVTRDNNNNIENFVTEKKDKNKLNIRTDYLMALSNNVAIARATLAMCSQFMDGTFIQRMSSYLTATKNNLLRAFSVAGIRMDFTSQAMMLQSALCVGNSLMNVLMEMLFPKSIAYVLRDILIKETTVRGLISKYIYEYIPFELQGLVTDLVASLCATHDSLNSIAKDNGITAREVPEVAQQNIKEAVEEENIVGNIIKEFENNTTGLDIPFPIIELTESQKLMSEDAIKEYVATETIANLQDLGYLDNLTEEEIKEFKEILIGGEISFELINKINKSAGNKFNYRFWGTYGASNEPLYAWNYEDKVIYTKTKTASNYSRLYNSDYSPYMLNSFKVLKDEAEKYHIYYVEDEDNMFEMERCEDKDVNSNALSQLTDYFINKGFKDRYRTLPCTKMISATKNARLYFACPQTESNIKFYINSKRVELDFFPIDLGYTTNLGTKIIYNVYFTTTGYNSNSVMLEIRQ